MPRPAGIVGFLKERVATRGSPRQIGEALAGAKPGSYWKYRVGDWRIICDIQNRRIIVFASCALEIGLRFTLIGRNRFPPLHAIHLAFG